MTIIYNPPSEASWTISEVLYRGQIQTYNLFENLTPKMNQEQLAEFYEKEKKRGKPYPANAQLFWAGVSRAYDLREENPEYVESFRIFLQSSLRKGINLFSGIDYNPKGEEDEIKHNPETSDEYSLRRNIVGPNRKIISADAESLEMVLGNCNIEKINSIANWINKTPFLIWRLNQKPEKKIECLVGFRAFSARLYLSCDGDPRSECPAFRVL